MSLQLVEGGGAQRFRNPYFEDLLTQPLACSACGAGGVTLEPTARPDEALCVCPSCGARKIWHAPAYAREPGRLPDGRVAEVAPWFVRKRDEGQLVCEVCGSSDLEFRTTLVPEAVFGDCRSCGDTRVYECPPGMAHVIPAGSRRAGPEPPGGRVIRFRPGRA